MSQHNMEKVSETFRLTVFGWFSYRSLGNNDKKRTDINPLMALSSGSISCLLTNVINPSIIFKYVFFFFFFDYNIQVCLLMQIVFKIKYAPEAGTSSLSFPSHYVLYISEELLFLEIDSRKYALNKCSFSGFCSRVLTVCGLSRREWQTFK